MIIINFKNYKHGIKALKLAEKIERYLPEAIVCLSAVDIGYVSFHTKLKVYTQHVDYFEKKNTTGFIIPEDVKEAGAIGTLLNHSENRIPEREIKETIKRCKKVGLKVILCVRSVSEARRYKKLKPWAIAYEDPVLVGSEKSITQYRQKDIAKFVRIIRGSGVFALCGAGVSTYEDVLTAKKLGCKGVLISSAIADASEKKVENLLKDLWKI